MPWGPKPGPGVRGGVWEQRLGDGGVFWGVVRGEGLGEAPGAEEEEGRRWLRRRVTRDSRLWGRLETEEAAPGFWMERREEDRPSPNRGDNGKEERGREKEQGKKEGGRVRQEEQEREGWSRKDKHVR